MMKTVLGVCFFTWFFILPVRADDVRFLADTRITLVDAVEAAQRHSGGRAVEARLDPDSFEPAYEISLVRDGRIFDIQVDGISGEILDYREDTDK